MASRAAADGTFDWTAAKERAKLSRKSPAQIDEFYPLFLTLVLKKIETMRRRRAKRRDCRRRGRGRRRQRAAPTNDADEANGGGGGDVNDETVKDVPLTYLQCRRLVQRIALLRSLREQVLVHPERDIKLLNAKKSTALPAWWTPKLDQGCCMASIATAWASGRTWCATRTCRSVRWPRPRARYVTSRSAPHRCRRCRRWRAARNRSSDAGERRPAPPRRRCAGGRERRAAAARHPGRQDAQGEGCVLQCDWLAARGAAQQAHRRLDDCGAGARRRGGAAGQSARAEATAHDRF
jgi:hypothetical protein